MASEEFNGQEKLYSPIFLTKWEHEEYDSNRIGMNQAEAVQYFKEIREALLNESLPKNATQGLMTYYHGFDDVKRKVNTLAVNDIEAHDGKLWAVATLELIEPLNADELADLKEYLGGQYSDGFGEGFEQRYIQVADGEINVHLWFHGDEFFIDTKQELEQRLGIELDSTPIHSPTKEHNPASKGLGARDLDNVAELKVKLNNRLNDNLADYFYTLRGLSMEDIISKSAYIASTFDAFHYLTKNSYLDASQMKYLLQFKNPLAVVADTIDSYGDRDHSFAMWEIFDREYACGGDYELMDKQTTPPPDIAEKPSVMEQLKQGRKEAQNRPAQAKEAQKIIDKCKRKSQPDTR
jgi:hypothetical protein